MVRWRNLLTLFSAVLIAAGIACGSSNQPKPPQIDVNEFLVEALGGETTVWKAGGDAFFFPASNLTESEIEKYDIGFTVFHENWTPATGLGPNFNATACSTCHVDHGRGQPLQRPNRPTEGLLLKFSVPGPNGPVNEPNYGEQFQDAAVLGVTPEGQILIEQRRVTGSFADGTRYTLLEPVYTFVDLAFGPLHPETMISPRVPQALIGMGLLEAIPAEAIERLADPEDIDGDGISGRVNMVPNRSTGQIDIGRFGWKAGQPTVEQQSAAAFNEDIGIITALYPIENCTSVQIDCHALSDSPGGVSSDLVRSMVFFTRLIAVPAMRGVDDPTVRRGAQLFASSGCASCHTPSFETGSSEIAALSNQRILPFTDLLLHDMGDELADNRPEFEASGREWRTAPLWGIGLVETVNEHTRFLHDGRARNLTEAVLWHGGEAERSRELFKKLSFEEREALIVFLEAL